MDNEQENTLTEDDYIKVPKGTTVNKEKYERQVQRADDAEKRAKELEEQIKQLSATSEADKATIEDFKTKVQEESDRYAKEKADLELELARKDKANELLRAGCIDTESGLASLRDDMTIAQLKEAKPHLFGTKTLPSSSAPADPPANTESDALRKALGLN